MPPRIVGQILTYLENVEDVDEFTQEVTIFKNGVSHEVDVGDTLRFVREDDVSGAAVAVTEVVFDPDDDRGQPDVQRVRVRVRRVPDVTDASGTFNPLERIDPSNDPNLPQDPNELDEWLVRFAPRAVLSAEFTASRTDFVTGVVVRDDPRNFITFSPFPLPLDDGTPSPPNENVSPFAGATVRFTKPVDLTSVKTTDTFFFATRNLLDPAEIEAFRMAGGRGDDSPEIDANAFSLDKFRTPHLVASRLFDEDGSQTTLRLQPVMGFFLDDTMREDTDLDFEEKDYKYYLHLLTGLEGVQDLSGNSVDLQAELVEDSEQIVIPFSLDTRDRNADEPLFPNNIVASVVRTYNSPDEDEQPSYYRNNEVPVPDMDALPESQSVPDIFGAVVYLEDGTIQARQTTRVRQVVDNMNQQPPPSQQSIFRWCPANLQTFGFAGNEMQVPTPTAATAFGAGIQNPLNPFGARLQTLWREIDLGLSRIDPLDFNLDVEQMYWAPFTGSPITFDEFDRVSLFLGHSERRPEPCVGSVSALPPMEGSGLTDQFALNYVHNPSTRGGDIETAPAPHPAYLDEVLTIDPGQAITEPTGTNRYLSLPEFQEPYFVWRDETVVEQGGSSGRGKDVADTNNGGGIMRPVIDNSDYNDYILSPFLGGYGAAVSGGGAQGLTFNQGTWSNAINFKLLEEFRSERSTGGLVGTIALPLLADFWTYCDSPALPAGNGFLAAGTNGWQISLTVQSSPLPAFRSYSGGFAGFGARPLPVRGPQRAGLEP